MRQRCVRYAGSDFFLVNIVCTANSTRLNIIYYILRMIVDAVRFPTLSVSSNAYDSNDRRDNKTIPGTILCNSMSETFIIICE